MLALDISLICSITCKLWSGASQTRSTTGPLAWFTPNNRHDSPHAGRSQSALSMSTPQSACGLTNGHIEIHEYSLEDPGVIDTKSD